MKHLMLSDNMLNASHLMPEIVSGMRSRRLPRAGAPAAPKRVKPATRLGRDIRRDIGLDDSTR